MIFKQTYTKPLPSDADISSRKGKQFAQFKNGKGKAVTGQLSSDGTRVILETKKWYVEYRNATGIVRRKAGYADKQATEQFSAELERQAARERVGIVDVPLEQISAPFQQHFTDWIADLQRAGRSADYIRKVRRRISRLRDSLHWVMLPSIQPDGVTRWLALQLRKGLGQRTANHYIEALNSFCNWCVTQKRTERNPITYVSKTQVTELKKIRRALTLEELSRLQEVSGPRWQVYMMAALNWLATKEITVAGVGRYSLGGEPPNRAEGRNDEITAW